MTIVYVITAFGIGGAEKLLLNVINKQVQEHTVHLIYLKDISDLIPFVNQDVKVKHVPLSLTTLLKLNTYFNQINPDIIHTHLGHADILGILASIKTKAKVFCTMHNIYFKNNSLDKLLFLIYFFIFRIKKVNVISISKSVENHVIRRLKQPKERSFLLYNAIPSKKTNNSKTNKNIDFLHLLFVGRLVKQKGVATLLKAIAYLKTKKIKLTIVGNGNLRNELERLTSQLNITNQVKFAGATENPEMYFDESDIFILPSVLEGFGIVILEAFRAKTAVIVSNIEGPSELVQHNKNGLLFQSQNEKELASQIKKLITNPKLRNKLAEEGYKTFTEKYHIDTYTTKLLKLYKNA